MSIGGDTPPRPAERRTAYEALADDDTGASRKRGKAPPASLGAQHPLRVGESELPSAKRDAVVGGRREEGRLPEEPPETIGGMGVDHGGRHAARRGGQIGGWTAFGAGSWRRCRDTRSAAMARANTRLWSLRVGAAGAAGRLGNPFSVTAAGGLAAARFHTALGALLPTGCIAVADSPHHRLDRQGGRQQPVRGFRKARCTIHGYPAKHFLPPLYWQLYAREPARTRPVGMFLRVVSRLFGVGVRCNCWNSPFLASPCATNSR